MATAMEALEDSVPWQHMVDMIEDMAVMAVMVAMVVLVPLALAVMGVMEVLEGIGVVWPPPRSQVEEDLDEKEEQRKRCHYISAPKPKQRGAKIIGADNAQQTDSPDCGVPQTGLLRWKWMIVKKFVESGRGQYLSGTERHRGPICTTCERIQGTLFESCSLSIKTNNY